MEINHRNMLRTFFDNKEYNKAIEYCNQQIKFDDSNYLFWSARGLAYLELHDYNNAIIDLSESINKNSKEIFGYINRGRAYIFLEKYDLSIIDYEFAITLNCKNVSFYDFLGLAYSNIGNHIKAIEYYSKYLNEYPDKDIYLWRAESFTILEKYKDANNGYEEVLTQEVKEVGKYVQINSLNKNIYTSQQPYNIYFDSNNSLNIPDFIKNPFNDLIVELKNEAAIYVLEFYDGEFYVGQSKKIITRLKQHYKKYKNIKNVFIKPLFEEGLIDEENKLIAVFENKLFRLKNDIQINFTNIFNYDCQIKWNSDLNFNFISGTKFDNEKFREEYHQRFAELKNKSFYVRLIPMIAQYIFKTIPNYIAGEYNYWSITCLPKFLLKENWVTRININGVPVFSVRYNNDESLQLMFFVSKLPFLYKLKEQKSMQDIFKKMPTLVMELRNIFDQTSEDEMTIFIDEKDYLNYMEDETILSAMRMFNLRMLNKAGENKDNKRRQYHCLDLADVVISQISQPLAR